MAGWQPSVTGVAVRSFGRTEPQRESRRRGGVWTLTALGEATNTVSPEARMANTAGCTRPICTVTRYFFFSFGRFSFFLARHSGFCAGRFLFRGEMLGRTSEALVWPWLGCWLFWPF